jgi:hypothetical protein
MATIGAEFGYLHGMCNTDSMVLLRLWLDSCLLHLMEEADVRDTSYR